VEGEKNMSTCQAYGCNVNMKEILNSLDNGETKVVLCPNHTAMLADELFTNKEVYAEPSERTDKNTCQCCQEENTIEYKDSEATFYLCEKHLSDLINLNLSPEAFKTLYQKVGNVHILHDDFYDPETGEAFQPRMEY
jgi:hypothetical protein